ncbi:MAG: hypothetical protein OXC01_17430 [Immundisolibacterales bacterium]|nr:hypothetical protein [Immundisolibacterales bacterium]
MSADREKQRPVEIRPDWPPVEKRPDWPERVIVPPREEGEDDGRD